MSIINLLPLNRNLPFIAYSAKMELYLLNIFPLSAGMMLYFLSRGCWREIAGGRAFFLFQVLLLVGSCSLPGFFRVQLLQCWQLIQCQDPAMRQQVGTAASSGTSLRVHSCAYSNQLWIAAWRRAYSLGALSFMDPTHTCFSQVL